MLHKVLHNTNPKLYYKLPQFAKPICITWHIAKQNDRAFVVARYNTYQFSWCITYSITHLWNSLPNETVLVVKQDWFIDKLKFFL